MLGYIIIHRDAEPKVSEPWKSASAHAVGWGDAGICICLVEQVPVLAGIGSEWQMQK